MGRKYLGSWELEEKDEVLQFIEFAEAYLSASKILCQGIEESVETAKYSDSCVVTYIAYHAVELFLKGMILNRNRNAKLHHDIENLSEQYRNLYAENEYVWNLPFVVYVLGENADANEMITQFKKELHQEQVHRYPVNKQGEIWKAAFAFEPKSFMDEVILPLEKDFNRLKKLINA